MCSKGAFGSVYRYDAEDSSVSYAGKIAPKRNRISYQKIFAEITIHRQMEHKNIVKVITAMNLHQGAILIMELCVYKSLRHVLKQRQFLTEPEVKFIVHQVLLGVHYIHSQRVIHKDLKPGNILVNKDFIVKIGDFGFAIAVGSRRDLHKTCGTRNYISPEGYLRSHYQFESDMWAIGCIVYELINGSPPFAAKTGNEVKFKVIQNKYRMPSVASYVVCKLIDRLLRSNPYRRLSAQQALEDDFFNNGLFPTTLHPSFHQKCYVFYAIDGSDGEPDTDWMANTKISVTSSQDTVEVPAPEIRQFMYHNYNTKIFTVMQCVRTRSPSAQNQKMYKLLNRCLAVMPCLPVKGENVGSPGIPLFILSWVECTDQYGFGYQLTDKSHGFCFNDGTRITLHADELKFDFYDIFGKCQTINANNTSAYMSKKLGILKKCREFILKKPGDNIKCESYKGGIIPQIRRCLLMSRTLVVELFNSTVQLSYNDLSKLIFFEGDKGFALSYVCNGRITSKWLTDIERYGWSLEVTNKMCQLRTVLLELWALDSRLM